MDARAEGKMPDLAMTSDCSPARVLECWGDDSAYYSVLHQVKYLFLSVFRIKRREIV